MLYYNYAFDLVLALPFYLAILVLRWPLWTIVLGFINGVSKPHAEGVFVIIS